MMKRIYILFTILFALCSASFAQPSAVKNAAKSVFKLTTYGSDGAEIATSHGVFVGEDGIGISSLKPFIGASSAIVTDVQGNQLNVIRIMGIDNIYDVIKFRVDGKTTPAVAATAQSATGAKAWLLSYAPESTAMTQTLVKNVETFMDKYSYYIFSFTVPNGTEACPFVNERGEVLGLLQPSTTSFDTYATDASYALSLTVTGMTANEQDMRKIGIPAVLPADKDQALLALMLAEQANDSVKLAAAASDFIQQFPTMIDGYNSRAKMAVAADNFKDAERDMETAIKKTETKDEAHYNYSKLIYSKLLYKADKEYKPWTLDKALDEAQQAYDINPLPVYKHQQAQIIYSKGEYEKALAMLTELTNTNLHKAELYYEASRCKLMLGAQPSEIIALLDSAINNTDTLRIQDAAPYFYARAEAYNAAGNYREAVFDMTRYEILVNRNVTPEFYYMREQIEVKAKLYKQALNDITLAIVLAPNEPTYFAEKASLELKVNMVPDAIKTAQQCIELSPEYADGYLILGLAQIHQDNKTEGLANLEKAKQLGNEQAQSLIDKYSK